MALKVILSQHSDISPRRLIIVKFLVYRFKDVVAKEDEINDNIVLLKTGSIFIWTKIEREKHVLSNSRSQSHSLLAVRRQPHLTRCQIHQLSRLAR